jgi:glutaredoxin 3
LTEVRSPQRQLSPDSVGPDRAESTFLRGIANKAKADKHHRFRDLYRCLNVDLLLACWLDLNKDAASGVDGVTAAAVVVLAGKFAFGKRFFNSSEGDSIMTTKREIEVFSAGCPACAETIELVNQVACPSCEVSILDMNRTDVAQRAKGLGIRSVPAVVIDGKLADCCTGRGPQEATLRAAGLGQPA